MSNKYQLLDNIDLSKLKGSIRAGVIQDGNFVKSIKIDSSVPGLSFQIGVPLDPEKRVRVPFGIWKEEDPAKAKANEAALKKALEIDLPPHLINKIKEIDAAILALCESKYKEWFPEKYAEKDFMFLDDKYSPLVRKGGKYDDRLFAKLNFTNSQYRTQAYQICNEGESGGPTLVEHDIKNIDFKMTTCAALIEITSLYIKKNCDWGAHAMIRLIQYAEPVTAGKNALNQMTWGGSGVVPTIVKAGQESASSKSGSKRKLEEEANDQQQKVKQQRRESTPIVVDEITADEADALMAQSQLFMS